MNWCEHMDGMPMDSVCSINICGKKGGNIVSFYKEQPVMFCMVCGTKKPEPKSLAEELYEAYYVSRISPNAFPDKFDSMHPDTKADWQRVADKAREILKEKGVGSDSQGK